MRQSVSVEEAALATQVDKLRKLLDRRLGEVMEAGDLVPFNGRLVPRAEVKTAFSKLRRKQWQIVVELAVLFAGLGAASFILYRLVLRLVQ